MKAVLMLDMPQTCGECQLGRFLNKEDFEDDAYICSAHTYKMGEDVASLTGKPSWCPLKPMPVKQDTKSVIGIDLVDGFKEGWDYGWNACLEELEK